MGHILSTNGTVSVVKKPNCLMIVAVDLNTGCVKFFLFKMALESRNSGSFEVVR